jgi:hypothetical protein
VIAYVSMFVFAGLALRYASESQDLGLKIGLKKKSQ